MALQHHHCQLVAVGYSLGYWASHRLYSPNMLLFRLFKRPNESSCLAY